MTKLTNWPVEEGRYLVGRKTSPVAVCTEATIGGIKVERNKVAIIGKCATENIGIEKIVKNIITNPYIRFLIVCGKTSRGHDVGQTLLALSQNGIDKEMRVIGSTGAIPLLKHLTHQEVDRFRKQVFIVDKQGETDNQKIQFTVEQCLQKKPGKFAGQSMKIKQLGKVKKIKCLKAKIWQKEYLHDPKGSFRIIIDRKKREIVTQHYNLDFDLDVQITGKTARAITETVFQKDLVADYSGSKNHAAYLGSELTKAEICLANGLDYIQDEPLKLFSGKGGLNEDGFGW